MVEANEVAVDYQVRPRVTFQPPVHYPESDGKPTAEIDTHIDLLIYLCEALSDLKSQVLGLELHVEDEVLRLVDPETGEKLLTPLEAREELRRVQEAYHQAEEARRQAEAEVEQLRAELERLRKGERQ